MTIIKENSLRVILSEPEKAVISELRHIANWFDDPEKSYPFECPVDGKPADRIRAIIQLMENQMMDRTVYPPQMGETRRIIP